MSYRSEQDTECNLDKTLQMQSKLPETAEETAPRSPFRALNFPEGAQQRARGMHVIPTLNVNNVCSRNLIYADSVVTKLSTR